MLLFGLRPGKTSAGWAGFGRQITLHFERLPIFFIYHHQNQNQHRKPIFVLVPLSLLNRNPHPSSPTPRLTFEVEGNIGRPLNGVSLARAHQLSRLRLSAANLNANRWPLQRQLTPRGAFDQMSVGHRDGGPGRCRPCPGVRAVTAADRR